MKCRRPRQNKGNRMGLCPDCERATRRTCYACGDMFAIKKNSERGMMYCPACLKTGPAS